MTDESTGLGPGIYTDLPLGVHSNMDSDVYHEPRLGVVSKSALDAIDRSPAHYRVWLDSAGKVTDALAFGRAFHAYLLEPAVFAEQYTEAPTFGDLRRTENKAKKLAWEEENQGKQSVSADDMAALRGMCAAVMSHPLAAKMLADGKPELTLVWEDGETGLKCKSRLDFYSEKHAMIVDVKSTLDAREHSFRKDVLRYGYHRQDALYRGAAHALGMPVEHFVLMAVEKSPPYGVATYTLDADAIGKGYTSTRRNIETMAHCMETGIWPCYTPGIHTLELPPWA